MPQEVFLVFFTSLNSGEYSLSGASFLLFLQSIANADTNMNIKKYIDRFRAWQHNPFHDDAPAKAESYRCANCGMEFVGNFCPHCGQRGGLGRVTWKSVRTSLMNVWGLGSRSMPYSLVQLIGRPGYFIRDYISGKRQVSYPPVRMLLIVSIVFFLTESLLGKSLITPEDTEGEFIMLAALDEWLDRNPGWGILVYSAIFLLPTWLLFRFAPAYPKHTLPEGFFIQVFLSTTFILVLLLQALLGDWIEFLATVLYVVTYHQLFGYSWWGTIWRLVLTVYTGMYSMQAVAMLFEHIFTGSAVSPKRTLTQEVLVEVGFLLLTVAMLTGAYYISKRNYRNQNENQNDKR